MSSFIVQYRRVMRVPSICLMLRGAAFPREYDMTPTSRARPLDAPLRRVLVGFACAALGAAGCARSEPEAYRGPGLREASLPPNDVAGAYRAALASAFSLDDPALWLLVDPLLLPRGAGLAGGDTMPPAIRSALQRHRLVKGTCQVPIEKARTPLVCRADRPGYVVRLSAPLALGAGHDSVQVHLVVQQYAVPRGPVAERLRFERAYHLVRRGPTWRAMREARLPQP
jgi:hypothetical protein